MKNKILILGVFFIGSFLGCKKDKTSVEQIPEGQLTKVVFKQNEGDFDFIKALPNGNILAIGETNDSIKLGTNTYYANGNDLVFVIFDKSGNILKSHLLSLPSDQYFIDADVALDGSIYFAFNFSGTINLGSGNLVSNGGSDICLTRFNSNLETINAYSYGSTEYDYDCSISIANGNQLIVVDELKSEFKLHGITIPILDNRSTMVVMKFNNTLSSSSFKEFSGNVSTVINPRSVVVDNNSNIYLIGYLVGKVYFGDEAQNVIGESQTFILKLNSDFETEWDFVGSGMGGSFGKELAIDENQNIFLLTQVEEDLSWLGTNYNFTSTGNIIQKINSAGNVIWTKKINGFYNYSYSKLSVNKDRVVFSMGKNDGILTIEKGGPAFSELIVLDNLGNLKWRKNCQSAGGTFNYLYIDNCCVDLENRVWINGVIQGKFDFNNIGSSIVEGNFSEGIYKSFILKY